MSFIIDRTRTHQQSLLDLVNFANADTVETLLTVANTGITKRGELYPGVYGLRLSNLSAEDDTVDVQHTKIELGDILLFSQDDLKWFNPLNIPSLTNVWDNAALQMVEGAIAKLGFTISKIFNPPNGCFVTYNADEQAWFITFRCDSFVFEELFLYRLPHYFGEYVTVKDLLGFQFNPIGSTAEPIPDAYPVDFTKDTWTLLAGLINFENNFGYVTENVVWDKLKVLSGSTVTGANTSIDLDVLGEPSEVVGDYVTFTYKRMNLATVWPSPPRLTVTDVGLDRNTETIDIPTLIASLQDRFLFNETDYSFTFEYLKKRITVKALDTNVAYLGTLQFTVDFGLGLADLVKVTRLNGFEKGKFY
ncbi:hypothetical protein pEaSNUABM11_00113 [Erwinia phage pEa_SNUABM_11]|nr:hypothetical protein pEaSNUABM11_00113 [Erwinia phage pEa_SNUABM_11]